METKEAVKSKVKIPAPEPQVAVHNFSTDPVMTQQDERSQYMLWAMQGKGNNGISAPDDARWSEPGYKKQLFGMAGPDKGELAAKKERENAQLRQQAQNWSRNFDAQHERAQLKSTTPTKSSNDTKPLVSKTTDTTKTTGDSIASTEAATPATASSSPKSTTPAAASATNTQAAPVNVTSTPSKDGLKPDSTAKDAEGASKNGEKKGDAGAASSDGGAVKAFLVANGEAKVNAAIKHTEILAHHQAKATPAAKKMQEAEHAVVTPDEERHATSNSSHVDAVASQDVAPVSGTQAKGKLTEKLSAAMPTTLDGLDNFKDQNGLASVNAEVQNATNASSAGMRASFVAINSPHPPAPGQATTPLPTPEQAPATETVAIGAGVVPPLPAEFTDASSYKKDSDDLMKKEGVSQEQLDMVDKGDLAEANKEKKDLHEKVATQPAAVRQDAAKHAAGVEKEMSEEENKTRGAMHAHRTGALQATSGKQQKAKTELEKKRAEVSAEINKRFTDCQTKITKRLGQLETQGMMAFEVGQARATREFEVQVKLDIDAFKQRRYSDWGGTARRIKDFFYGIDKFPEVKTAFDNARAAYVAKIDTLVANITTYSNNVVAECKAELAATKEGIRVFVSKLGKELQGVGRSSMAEMDKHLKELEGQIDQQAASLRKKLADKRTAAIAAIDKRIADMKESMSGALNKIGALLLFAAKKFFTWALEAAGFSPDDIMGILNKGEAVLKAVFTDPIRFVKNLINSAILGFKNFGKNIVVHLKNAIFNWLTGALEGIQLPTSWDAMGIISVVMQIAGATWAAMRGKLLKLMPEPAVVALETGFTLVKTLVTQGPTAAWEQLKEMAGELQETFMTAVQDFVRDSIVMKAIETIVEMFIPGAGIVKAIIGIYDTIMFFVNKAKDIMSMVGNFLNSAGDMAAGNIGGAAEKLESGLAAGLVLVVNFLSKFLHLDGITAKIRAAIAKVREKVGAALDKVVKWVKDKAQAFFGKKEGTDGKSKEGLEDEKIDFKTKDDHSHNIALKGDVDHIHIIVSSTPITFENLVSKRRSENIDAPTKEALSKAETFKGELNSLIVQYRESTKSDATEAKRSDLKRKIREKLKLISEQLRLAGIDTQAVDTTKTKVSHDGSGGRARRVTAQPLTHLPGNTAGSTPTEDPKGWDVLEKRSQLQGSDKVDMSHWVRAHLLNAQLHGPGVAWNLVPGTSETNGRMKSFVENDAKKAIYGDATKLYYYETTVEYHTDDPDPEMNLFPKLIQIQWGELEKNGDSYKRLSEKGKKFEQEKPPKHNLENASFNQSSPLQMVNAVKKANEIKKANFDIPSAIFRAIYDVRRAKPDQHFDGVKTMMLLLAAKNPDFANYKTVIESIESSKTITFNSLS